MALSTNYKRNLDNEQKRVNEQLELAKEMARDIAEEEGCSYIEALQMACDVILKREN